MDVTVDNFAEAVAALEECLKRGDFVTLDTEFSGLHVKALSFQQQRAVDSLQMAHSLQQINYAQRRHAVSQFLVFQFGICVFEWDTANRRYLARPFNFNIFPDEMSDKLFSCSAATLKFLSANKLDFNKVIGKGVPYLSHQDAEVLRNKPLGLPSIDVTAIEDKQFMYNHLNTIMDWMSDLPAYHAYLNLALPNRFQCSVLCQEIPSRYNELVAELVECDFASRKFTVRVTKLPAGERVQFMKGVEDKERAEREENIRERVGFRRCIDLVSQAGSIVVGHNMFLDMLHTYDKFVRPLPHDLTQFKHEWRSVFQNIIDTKYIAHYHKRPQVPLETI